MVGANEPLMTCPHTAAASARKSHISRLTIIIGILAGLAAVLFTLAIKGTTHLLFGLSPSSLRYVLVPTLMSLVTGFLLDSFSRKLAAAEFRKRKPPTISTRETSQVGWLSENF